MSWKDDNIEVSKLFGAKNPYSKFLEHSKELKNLNIPYNSQRDNKFAPKSSCNVTCLQMTLANSYSITDDEIYLLCQTKEVHQQVEKRYRNDYNKWIKSYIDSGRSTEVLVILQEASHQILQSDRYSKVTFSMNHNLILSEIDKGYPVIICGNFTGGHFVVIKGYDMKSNSYIVNDPWGDWNKKYKDFNGENKYYSFQKVWRIMYKYGILIHADKKTFV